MVAVVYTVVELLKLKLHILEPFENRQGFVVQGFVGILAGELLHYADLAASSNVNCTLVGNVLAAQHSEQRCFAAAVDSYETYPVVIVYVKGHSAEKRPFSERHRDII